MTPCSCSLTSTSSRSALGRDLLEGRPFGVMQVHELDAVDAEQLQRTLD
ncbi:MAG: hypothetical protein U0744_14760 [Gemmataceae bacterium]